MRGTPDVADTAGNVVHEPGNQGSGSPHSGHTGARSFSGRLFRLSGMALAVRLFGHAVTHDNAQLTCVSLMHLHIHDIVECGITDRAGHENHGEPWQGPGDVRSVLVIDRMHQTLPALHG